MEELKKILIYLALFCAAVYLWVALFVDPTIGYYYPYVDDLSIVEQSDEVFRTRAGCFEWGRIQQMNNEGEGAYACGRECVYQERQDFYLCENISRLRE